MNKNKLIFIHIPKTAGTAVLEAIGKKGEGGRNHLPWYVYYTSNHLKFRNYYKFSFVRNPWDRAYSAYEYLLNGGNQHEDIKVSEMIRKFDDFNDFVVNGLGQGMLRNHLMFAPQSDFIIGPTGEIVVDFVGRFENLNEDFSILADKLGVNPVLKKQNVNSKKKKNNYIQAYCTNESINIVANIYKQDITVFGYQFYSDK